MKLALHRSISFWSGILVMGFIVWMWWDSSRMYVSTRKDSSRICQTHGGIYVITNEPFIPGPRLQFEHGPHSKLLREIPWRTFPRPLWLTGDAEANPPRSRSYQSHEEWLRAWIQPSPGRMTLCFIPHWLILLLVVMTWAGLLGWRVRRRSKEPRMGTDLHG